MADLQIRELERRTAVGDMVARDLLAVERLRIGQCGWCAEALEITGLARICVSCRLGWDFPGARGGLFSYRPWKEVAKDEMDGES